MTQCRKCGVDFEKESKRGRPWLVCEKCRIVRQQLDTMPEEQSEVLL